MRMKNGRILPRHGDEDVDVWVEPKNCTREGIEELIKEIDRHGYELVIKPRRGFTLINTREERITHSIKCGSVPFRRKKYTLGR